jgi:hypothetical protein
MRSSLEGKECRLRSMIEHIRATVRTSEEPVGPPLTADALSTLAAEAVRVARTAASIHAYHAAHRLRPRLTERSRSSVERQP